METRGSQKVDLLRRVVIARISGALVEQWPEITGIYNRCHFASLDHPSVSSIPLFSVVYGNRAANSSRLETR
jgi:hypothetical protein